MKKLNYVMDFVSILSFVFLFACGKDDLPNDNRKLINFNCFQEVGNLHNAFMTNVQNEFIENDEVKSLNDKLDYVNSIHMEFIDNYDLSTNDKIALEQEFGRAKHLTDVNTVLELVNIRTDSKSEKASQSLYSTLDSALNYRLIDDFEYSILTNLLNLAWSSYEGTISHTQLKASIEKMKNDWIAVEYKTGSGNGYISGYTIAVSLSSLEWWEDYAEDQELLTKEKTIIPVWVAADAVGALWGAASGAIGSYLVNDEVNWGSVGFGALSGAVAGSTGVVGKVAKWISKL